MSVPSIADYFEAPWLFASTEAAARDAFASTIEAALAPDEALIDLFCGAGGWFGMAEDGKAHKMGLRVDAAVNHSPLAIEWHAKNHPHCVHLQGDAWTTRPADVLEAIRVRRGVAVRPRMGWLVASAACTTHSRARGSAPISKRIHMLGWCCARYIKDGNPRGFTLENVVEWQDWGPVSRKTGKPDPARKGQHYRALLKYLRGLGYTVESRIIEAADHGTHCRRRRLFVQGRRDGCPIFWPEESHAAHIGSGRGRSVLAGRTIGGSVRHRRSADQNGGRDSERDDARCVVSSAKPSRSRGADVARSGAGSVSHEGPRPHRPAYEVIDWSDLGHSIFFTAAEGKAARCKRPLAEKSLQRIARGIIKHVLNDPAPFVIRTTQTGGGVGGAWPVAAPMPTQTTRQDLAVCTPVIASLAHGDDGTNGRRWRSVSELLGGIHAGGNNWGIGSPILMPCGGPKREPSRADEPMQTVLTREDRGVCTPLLLSLRNHDTGSRADVPFDTVSAGGNHAALVLPFLTQYYGQGESTRADQVIPTVVTKDRHALVSVVIDGQTFVMVDILFRMLRPHELAAAMGFARSYQFPKSARAAVQLIGNAVAPPVGEALLLAALPGGRRVA